MPPKSEHLSFDRILQERGIISSCDMGEKIHNLMDRGAQKHGGWHHQKSDPRHSLPGVRERLNTLADHDYDQTVLTDCVRIACGHIALDEARGDTRQALTIMRKRRWFSTFYRHR